MKITFFSTQAYDKTFFTGCNRPFGYELEFHKSASDTSSAKLLTGSDVICIFVNDTCDAAVIQLLAQQGVKLVALRCAGFNIAYLKSGIRSLRGRNDRSNPLKFKEYPNKDCFTSFAMTTFEISSNVDVAAAHEAGIKIVRVPAYSPEAVAEHATALILTLNRKIHKAYNRVREQNFSLNGLPGFDLHGKTVGIIGTGHIGRAFARIMTGFGCRVMAFDLIANRDLQEAGVEYTDISTLFSAADIISLHCPLNDSTRHLVNSETMTLMKDGVMLINTSRGGLIDTRAAIAGLKKGKPGSLGIDVYEQEEKLFFRDLSGDIIQDDTIQRLMSFPNVIITAHQAFFTREALTQIAQVTPGNIKNWSEGDYRDTFSIRA